MIEQISVFLEDKKGELAEVTELLSKNQISIISINLSESSDFGILKLIVDDTKKAKEIMDSAGFSSSITKLIAVEIQNRIGSFNKVVHLLSDCGVDIKYTYTIRSKERGVFVFRVDNDRGEIATKCLKEGGIEVLEQL